MNSYVRYYLRTAIKYELLGKQLTIQRYLILSGYFSCMFLSLNYVKLSIIVNTIEKCSNKIKKKLIRLSKN